MEQKMKINKLAELNEILTELEDEGFFREADVLHQEFIKISQVTLDQPKPNFKDMLTEYAPSFLKLCRTYPTRARSFGVPTYTADPTYANIKFVQELLLASPYVKAEEKKGLVADGAFGPATMKIMDNLRRLLNKILYDAYAAKYQVKDSSGKIITL
jgi:hypothetical protein